MANRRGRYPAEVRERAVRMAFEHQGECPTQWNAIVSIGEKSQGGVGFFARELDPQPPKR